MFAACSNNDVRNDIEENEVEIGFTSVQNKPTKAEITDNAALAAEGGFVVWGYKAKTATPVVWTVDAYTVFDAVNVYSSGNGGAYISGDDTNWTYATKKYWDKNATYCFYAVAPYNPTSGATYGVTDAANNARMITITGATSGLASASDDHLIDRDGVKDRNGATQTNVDFDFHHVMAKVDFKLVKSSSVKGTLKVQNVTMTGWKNGAGNFTQNSATNPTTLNASEWSISATTTGTAEVLKNADTEVTTADTYGTNTYIMVPQVIATDALTFTVDYTIDGEPFKAHVGTISTEQTWGTDSHTTYTLTIGPKTIEFDVNSICGFDVNNPQSGTIQ